MNNDTQYFDKDVARLSESAPRWNVKSVHGPDAECVENVTAHRVLPKDRHFVGEVNYKGWKVNLLADGARVHLGNSGDPSPPIIGPVFKRWEDEEAGKKGTPGITVSWYYRPDQTATRQFSEGEVIKTSPMSHWEGEILDLRERVEKLLREKVTASTNVSAFIELAEGSREHLPYAEPWENTAQRHGRRTKIADDIVHWQRSIVVAIFLLVTALFFSRLTA